MVVIKRASMATRDVRTRKPLNDDPIRLSKLNWDQMTPPSQYEKKDYDRRT